MPTLTLTVTVAPRDEISFIKNFSAFAVETLCKPEEYIMINIIKNHMLYFKGSFEPAYLLRIVSLGNISPEQNEKYSKLFFAHLTEALGIKDDRGYIVFEDPGMAYMAHKGATFETIFSE